MSEVVLTDGKKIENNEWDEMLQFWDKKVWLVDDDKTMPHWYFKRMFPELWLDKKNIKNFFSWEGVIEWIMNHEEIPDLILMDYQMLWINWAQAARQIRKTCKERQVEAPIIISHSTNKALQDSEYKAFDELFLWVWLMQIDLKSLFEKYLWDWADIEEATEKLWWEIKDLTLNLDLNLN